MASSSECLFCTVISSRYAGLFTPEPSYRARNADSQNPVATSADESFGVEAGRLATGQAAPARLGKMGQ